MGASNHDMKDLKFSEVSKHNIKGVSGGEQTQYEGCLGAIKDNVKGTQFSGG